MTGSYILTVLRLAERKKGKKAKPYRKSLPTA